MMPPFSLGLRAVLDQGVNRYGKKSSEETQDDEVNRDGEEGKSRTGKKCR